MNKELYELNLEIQNVKRELWDILEDEKDVIGNELTIKVSQKLDRLIVRYIQICRCSE